ncbi:glycosyltransferase [Paenibacillus sp. 1P03SA]|uniref:glycosyltransferase n=1 Tax=Paenibacillus sp. 1P03SA TaxID=3132294 RepID=UPI0039A3AFB6
MANEERDRLEGYRYNLPFFEHLHKELQNAAGMSRNPAGEDAPGEGDGHPGAETVPSGTARPERMLNPHTDNLLRRIEERIALLDKVRECSDDLVPLIGEEPPGMREELAALGESGYGNLTETLLRPGRATISVVIPVLNEERCITRCLDSIRGLADEIIVLDTGSTDGTVDLIRGDYPHVRIEFAEWQDDFAGIRNRLNDLAAGDWIFQLDADEALIGDGAELRAFLQSVR